MEHTPHTEYVERLDTIKQKVNSNTEKVGEDGIVDLNEAIDSQKLTKQWIKEINRVKKEIRLTVRSIRNEYKVKLADDELGRWSRKRLTQERTLTIAPYDILIDSIDKQILILEDMHNIMVDVEHENRELQQPANEPIELDLSVVEIEVSDIIKILKKWRAIQTKANNAIDNSDNSKLVIKVEGFRDGLNVAISDFESILPDDILSKAD